MTRKLKHTAITAFAQGHTQLHLGLETGSLTLESKSPNTILTITKTIVILIIQIANTIQYATPFV